MALLRPTPLFVLAIVFIALVVVTMTIVISIHNHHFNEAANRLLNPETCVSKTGHKKVPCPDGVSE